VPVPKLQKKKLAASKIFQRVKAIAIAKPPATQIIVTITISSTKWNQMGFHKEKNHLNAKSVVHQKSNVVLARVLRSKPVLFGQMLVVSAVRKLFSPIEDIVEHTTGVVPPFQQNDRVKLSLLKRLAALKSTE